LQTEIYYYPTFCITTKLSFMYQLKYESFDNQFYTMNRAFIQPAIQGY
jgi:hypothetical protein